MSSFSFKGISSNAFNIISSTKRPVMPSMRQNMLEMPGMHGTYDFGRNTFVDREISVHIAYIADDYEKLRLQAREIAGWLYTKQYEQLIFDDEPDKYYLARVYNVSELQNLYRLGEADIVFYCQPFAYDINTPDTIELDGEILLDSTYQIGVATLALSPTTTNTITIDNYGTIDTRPIISVSGYLVEFTIEINGKSITVNYGGGADTVTINSEKYTIKKSDGTNALDLATGDIESFFEFEPGENEISIDFDGSTGLATIEFKTKYL